MILKNLTGEVTYLPFNDIELQPQQEFSVDMVDEAAVEEAKQLTKAGTLERVWQPKDLVLFDVVGEVDDITQVDFTIMGLRKESPSYDKGRKVGSKYFHNEVEGGVAGDVGQGLLAVEKLFDDILDDAGNLVGIAMLIAWYNFDGTIGISKAETAVTFNKFAAQTEQRKRRGRQLDYLVAGAIDTPLEPYVNTIFDHYYEKSMKYREKGSSEFVDAINTETDPQILGLLGIEVAPDTHPGYTLKMSLLNQID